MLPEPETLPETLPATLPATLPPPLDTASRRHRPRHPRVDPGRSQGAIEVSRLLHPRHQRMPPTAVCSALDRWLRRLVGSHRRVLCLMVLSIDAGSGWAPWSLLPKAQVCCVVEPSLLPPHPTPLTGSVACDQGAGWRPLGVVWNQEHGFLPVGRPMRTYAYTKMHTHKGIHT